MNASARKKTSGHASSPLEFQAEVIRLVIERGCRGSRQRTISEGARTCCGFERAIRGALARQVGYFLDRLQAAALPDRLTVYFLSMLGPTARWFAQALDLPPPPGL
ncbi:MAG: hypothetical protein M1118_08220 [Chloroflexi bacterium]|nr:hypothetical protein [Chloroflexota bacterium]